MIPEIFIENWRKTVKWQMIDQIEQDLIISRALIDLYSDPHVKDALVFRFVFCITGTLVGYKSKNQIDLGIFEQLDRVILKPDIFVDFLIYYKTLAAKNLVLRFRSSKILSSISMYSTFFEIPVEVDHHLWRDRKCYFY